MTGLEAPALNPDLTAAERREFASSLLSESTPVALAIRDAFANVPREKFLGPPPWVAFRETDGKHVVTDPRALYSMDLVEILESPRINTGDPRLWSDVFAAIGEFSGRTVCHVGSGRGYFTAVLAHLVGTGGHVIGWEIEPSLAAAAQASLRLYSHVELRQGNGLDADVRDADIIIASAGLSVIPPSWLNDTRAGSLLAFPLTARAKWEAVPGLTVEGGTGAFLRLVKVESGLFRAKFLRPVSFYPCVGGQCEELEQRIREAFRGGRMDEVKLLRSGPGEPDARWLEGDGWHLSVA